MVACVLVSLILPAVDLFIETAASSVISGVDVGQSFIPPHYLCKVSFHPQSLYSLFACALFFRKGIAVKGSYPCFYMFLVLHIVCPFPEAEA